jgi:hypothetical protein
MHHVIRAHDIACPLPTHVVLLVDLEPPGTDTSRSARVVHGHQVVRNRAGMTTLVPLDLDSVAGGSCERLDGDAVGRWHVAGHVVGGDVLDGRVAGRHADTDGLSFCDIVDPELLPILVGRDGGDEGRGEEGFGEHFGGWWWKVVLVWSSMYSNFEVVVITDHVG